jgi:alkylation response protein AidB-like acyl-CoA dehydrogenase
MDFSFTEDQRILMHQLEEFAKKEIAPSALERDNAAVWDWDLWKKMAEMGLMGMPYPEEYGGGGYSCVDTCLASEALSRGGADGGLTLAWHASMILCGIPIWKFGTEEQKQKYLPKMSTGEWVGAFCLTEPNSGSDAASMKTRAVKKGDKWILNGTKMFITNGPIANHLVVTAVTDPKLKAFGISTFIVDADSPGFSAGKELDKMGVRTSKTSEIFFEDCEIPEDALLGPLNFGFVQTAKTILGWERSVLLAPSVGGFAWGLEKSMRYAKDRVQFKKPICEFGEIQDMLAKQRVWLEVTRNMILQVAWMLDNDMPNLVEAGISKLFISEASIKAADIVVQIHGGYGLMKEYEVERGIRDAKLGTIGAGTSEVQRSIIARSIMNLGY